MERERRQPTVFGLMLPALLAFCLAPRASLSMSLLPVQAPGAQPSGSSIIGAPSSPFLTAPSPLTGPSSQQPAASSSPSFTRPGALPASPPVVTGCSAGGCLDSSGNWYSGAAGAYVNKNGAACARMGSWMQCN